MPGYTHDQLAALGRKPEDYRWCPECKLWWHKCGIRLHLAAEDRKAAERRPPPARPHKASPARRRWQRIRAKDLTVKSDIKVPNEIYPWERVLLAPVVRKFLAKVIESAEDEGDEANSE